MKISYNWLQTYFEEKLPNPEEVSEGITFHSFEVEEMEKRGNNTIFDIKVLPDRAHDCLSHWGIAKEIAAIFNLKIKEKKYQRFESKTTNLSIEVRGKECLRYMGRILRNIKVRPSPDWLKERLESIGQKSINNVVDAANFVMFDLGQPIHSFDLDKLASEKLIVRNAQNGEKIITLDKKSIDLDESMLVISDERDPLVIAGIKGGTKAEVDNNTKNILIEVANFNSTVIRKTAKKINILTDAVKRYENEISPELCTEAMKAITDLIFTLAGGEAEDIVDEYLQKAEQKIIPIGTEYINKRLGSNFSKEEIESVWKKLNFEYTKRDENFEVKIPFLRIDLTGPHDLSEEVIRVLGYEKLEEKLPEIKLKVKIDENFFKLLLARRKLLEDGYSEVMTYVFRDKGEVEVLASASDKKFLRMNLADTLKESLKLNQINAPLLGMSNIKIFEIGTVFKKDGEEIHVAWNEKDEVKEITLDKFVPEKFTSPAFSTLSLIKRESRRGAFKMWSPFPFIVRDVAVWVKEKEDKEKLEKLLMENGTELLVKKPYLFDSFTSPKDGKTSYAFRLIFQSYDRTLTDQEVNEIMTKINHKIRENPSWEVR
jgi:phenylalanyl-tRNA synthetase beta chain